jgi:hypothetical protein
MILQMKEEVIAMYRRCAKKSLYYERYLPQQVSFFSRAGMDLSQTVTGLRS